MARKLSLALGLILLCTFTISGARKPILALNFHIEGSRLDGAKMVQPIKLGNPAKIHYFRRQPELTQRHVKGYYPFPANDGSFGAAFILNDSGTKTLEVLSLTHQGSRLLTVLDSDPVDNIPLDKPVTDGVIVVWGGLSEADVAKFSKVFKRIAPEQGSRGAARSAGMPERATDKKGKKKLLPRVNSGDEAKKKKPKRPRKKLFNFGRRKKD